MRGICLTFLQSARRHCILIRHQGPNQLPSSAHHPLRREGDPYFAWQLHWCLMLLATEGIPCTTSRHVGKRSALRLGSNNPVQGNDCCKRQRKKSKGIVSQQLGSRGGPARVLLTSCVVREHRDSVQAILCRSHVRSRHSSACRRQTRLFPSHVRRKET